MLPHEHDPATNINTLQQTSMYINSNHKAQASFSSHQELVWTRTLFQFFFQYPEHCSDPSSHGTADPFRYSHNLRPKISSIHFKVLSPSPPRPPGAVCITTL